MEILLKVVLNTIILIINKAEKIEIVKVAQLLQEYRMPGTPPLPLIFFYTHKSTRLSVIHLYKGVFILDFYISFNIKKLILDCN